MRHPGDSRASGSKAERPDVYSYLDYRAFLKDWLAYRKAGQSKSSLRTLAREANLTAGYLSMVLAGTRPLTDKALAKLVQVLKLTDSEATYLAQLLILGNSQDHHERFAAVQKMKRYGSYRAYNPKETEVYQYLSQWYYVAIREMTALPDFRADERWIQERLRVRVELPEIREALQFLKDHGFIQLFEDGRAVPPEKHLDCDGGVYRLSMSNFHKQALQLAGESIENTDREERRLLGHALALDQAGFDRAKDILEEAYDRIRTMIPSVASAESVYYMELALFPFTKKPEKEKREKSS